MNLGAAERPLRDLLGAIGWDDAPVERLTIEERPKVLATPWPVAPLAAAVLGAVGLAASRIRELRTGERPRISLDMREAELAMASSSYLLVDGKPAKFRDPFTGFYKAAGGEWVYLHGNFPHLRDGLLALLSVANDADAVKAAVAERRAEDIEAEAIRRGLCAARVRERSAWLREPQAAVIAAQPLVHLERSGAAAMPLPPGGERPLSGLRMLDLSRVIAGPMAGRTMAEHGATAMRIASPRLPSIPSLVIDTGFGKHAAFAELDTAEGRASLRALAAEADIVLDAYRPASLRGRGFGPDDLGRLNPHLVHLSLSAFSLQGPWQGRRGYDSLVQATTGMAAEARGGRGPALLPCQPLDYLTGYLAAFAAMLALIRRHEQGGRWQATLSLAATAHWMWRMRDALGDDATYPSANPDVAAVADLLDTYDTAFGRVTALRPALRFDGARAGWSRMPVPLGSDPAYWPRS